MFDQNRSLFPRLLMSTAALSFGLVACSGDDDDLGIDRPMVTPNPGGPKDPTVPTTGDNDDTSDDDESTGGGGEGGGGGDELGGPGDPLCGNGMLDPGEECDLGVGNNRNDGACTLMCKQAICGDGLVWAGYEVCDLGMGNNDQIYGGCTTQCKEGPYCGDGIVQDYAGEECDLGSKNGTGQGEQDSVPCDDGCRFEAKLVFLSSETFTGEHLGDFRCGHLAKDAGLDNHTNFKAWLSTATSNPATSFTPHNLPLVQVNGIRVAHNLAQLFSDGPNPGIMVTEKGETLPLARVWTGTGSNGTLYEPGTDCNGWLSKLPTDKGRVGISGVSEADHAQWYANKHWTSFLSLDCELALRIYCIEQ